MKETHDFSLHNINKKFHFFKNQTKIAVFLEKFYKNFRKRPTKHVLSLLVLKNIPIKANPNGLV